jgi:hypothetical protein
MKVWTVVKINGISDIVPALAGLRNGSIEVGTVKKEE